MLEACKSFVLNSSAANNSWLRYVGLDEEESEMHSNIAEIWSNPIYAMITKFNNRLWYRRTQYSKLQQILSHSQHAEKSTNQPLAKNK